jgi:hypothetical protein
MKIVLFVVLCLFTNSAFAVKSDLRSINGVKYPNDLSEGSTPVEASAWTLDLQVGEQAPGFSEMLDYALPAPDQEEAGSCLYMSLTGIAEWWVAKLNPRVSRTPDGPIDLSERFLMNTAGADETTPGLANWKTDSVYLFNRAGSAIRNHDYRFTKGWYKTDSNGDYVPAKPNARGASYDAAYNWIDEMPNVPQGSRVVLPKFERRMFITLRLSDCR